MRGVLYHAQRVTGRVASRDVYDRSNRGTN